MSAVTAPARPAAARSPAPPPRTAFVLAGGAALAAMQAGMLHALYEHGIVPDVLAGTSAGTLNAAFLASRPPAVASTERLAAIYGAPASSHSAFPRSSAAWPTRRRHGTGRLPSWM
jgi:predicted acylesterase/phospholipase RssA